MNSCVFLFDKLIKSAWLHGKCFLRLQSHSIAALNRIMCDSGIAMLFRPVGSTLSQGLSFTRAGLKLGAQKARVGFGLGKGASPLCQLGSLGRYMLWCLERSPCCQESGILMLSVFSDDLSCCGETCVYDVYPRHCQFFRSLVFAFLCHLLGALMSLGAPVVELPESLAFVSMLCEQTMVSCTHVATVFTASQRLEKTTSQTTSSQRQLRDLQSLQWSW